MPKPNQLLPTLKPIMLDGSPLDLNYFLTTDYQDATSASVELPAIIEYVNENLQAMIEGKITSKAALERARAAAYFDLKQGLWETRNYEGKPTEKALEMAVELEQVVIDAVQTFATFSGYASRLYNLIQTLHAKMGMTRTSEATRRALLEEADKPSEE
jgi:hypothetical protein